MNRSDIQRIIKDEIIKLYEAKVILKPKELGDGVPVTIYIDDEGDLIMTNKQGGMISFHSDQIPQLKKYLAKVK